MSDISATLARGAVTAVGRLHRAGKRWRMPLRDDGWRSTPVDDLLLGDELHFPAGLRVTDLALRIRFPATPGFASCPVEVVYWLTGMVACPQCRKVAVHSVTITAGRHRPASRWTFTRRCECGAQWCQDGQALHP